MLNAIAVDDEPIALEVIRKLSEKITFLQMKGYFSNPVEAADYLQKNKTDLMFLDIKMPDMSGIEFLKSIPAPPLVIFTTAFSEHAVQSFELNAIDYLLKPFSFSRFLKACNKAHEQLELRKNFQANQAISPALFIKSGYEHVKIEMEKILYVEGKGNYIQFTTDQQKVLSRLTMSEAENLLPRFHFMRIHRSFIVAKRKISKVDKKSVWLGHIELPVGPGYSSEIERLTARQP